MYRHMLKTESSYVSKKIREIEPQNKQPEYTKGKNTKAQTKRPYCYF